MFKINFWNLIFDIITRNFPNIAKTTSEAIIPTLWNWIKLPLFNSPLGCLITGVCVVDRYEMEGNSFEKKLFLAWNLNGKSIENTSFHFYLSQMDSYVHA